MMQRSLFAHPQVVPNGLEKNIGSRLSTSRRHRSDGGFTLIELMVVVLILGILMAIAIPTFFGAKSSANDVSAKANVRNALTAEKTYLVNNTGYTSSVSALKAIEPGIQWVSAGSSYTIPLQVGQVGAMVESGNGTNDVIVLMGLSSTKTCWIVADESIAGQYATGSWYTETTGNQNSCTLPTSASPPLAANPPTGKAAVGVWGASW